MRTTDPASSRFTNRPSKRCRESDGLAWPAPPDRASFAARSQGEYPSISVSSEELRDVQIMTIPPRRPTLCTVSGAVIVEMMSAPTSNSSSRTHVACAGRLTSRSKARQGNPKVFATAVMLSRMPSCDGHQFDPWIAHQEVRANRRDFPRSESRDPKASSRVDHQFESPPLGGGFRSSKIVRHYKWLEWPSAVYGSHFAGLSAFCGRMRPKVSGRKPPFPKMLFASGSSRPTVSGHRRFCCSQMSKIAGRGARSKGRHQLAVNWPLLRSITDRVQSALKGGFPSYNYFVCAVV